MKNSVATAQQLISQLAVVRWTRKCPPDSIWRLALDELQQILRDACKAVLIILDVH